MYGQVNKGRNKSHISKDWSRTNLQPLVVSKNIYFPTSWQVVVGSQWKINP